MRVVFRKIARRDLLDIAAYIGQGCPCTCSKLHCGIAQPVPVTDRASVFRQSAADILDDLRIAPHGNYVIYYLIQSGKIVILRISHGSRLIDAAELSES